MRFYLDTCSLNRPWDDQSQVRVHLEAEAVLYFVSEARQGRLEMVSSGYLIEEILQTQDQKRRDDLLALTAPAAIYVPASDDLLLSSKSFAACNIQDYDALHVAVALAAQCDYFFTTDHKLLKRGQRADSLQKLKFLNPADWPPETDIP